jgi:hypothetical protein
VQVRSLKDVFTEQDHNSHGKTDGNRGKPVSIAGGLAETCTGYFSNISLGHHRYIYFVCLKKGEILLIPCQPA